MTYMLLLNCALKLVEEIILYYDARSKKYKKKLKLLVYIYAEYLFNLNGSQKQKLPFL